MSRAACSVLVACALSALLAACSTEQRTTEVAGTPDKVPPEEADAQKRAQARVELASAYFSRGQLNTALEQAKHCDRNPIPTTARPTTCSD